MSGQNDHPHIQGTPFTPFQQQATAALDNVEPIQIDIDQSPSRPISLLDIDVRNGVRVYPAIPPALPVMDLAAAAGAVPLAEMTMEEKVLHLTRLAEAQQKQMQEANDFANRQAEQLRISQDTVQQLTAAFRDMASQPRSSNPPPKKKPELPPFDSKNILIWIRRTEAAYARVGVVDAKDKFAFLESMFQIKLNPRIDAFLYGSNTELDWTNFIQYLKDEYGPTKRQKAQKLLSENSRHDMKPSQFLTQLEEDTADVAIDDVRKEHLLRTLPPQIRQMMGKEVENKTARQVADWSDQFFDRQGRLLEKTSQPVNSISNGLPTTASAAAASSSSFTNAFSDEETDINFVKKGGFQRNDRGRSRNRNQRSNSRPGFNRFPNASSASSRPSGDASQQRQQQYPPGTCRFHRKFGNKANKCISDCPQFKSFSAQQQQQQGNGNGGRRM